MNGSGSTPADVWPSPTLVLEDVIDAVLWGTGGVLGVPKGGYLACEWLTRKRCFRVTLDVVVMPPEKRGEPEGTGAVRLTTWEKVAPNLNGGS